MSDYSAPIAIHTPESEPLGATVVRPAPVLAPTPNAETLVRATTAGTAPEQPVVSSGSAGTSGAGT